MTSSQHHAEQPPTALIRNVDAIEIPVPTLEKGLAFYRDRLGHRLIWRTETAAGLQLPDSDAEIVLQTEREDAAVDLLVDSADDAARAIISAGGKVIVPPFDMQIGRCVIVEDPWNNRLVLLDMSKGRLLTDACGHIIGNVEP